MSGYIVIGSGPSGVIAAKTLLDSGARVTVIDGGDACPEDKRKVIDELSRSAPEDWNPGSDDPIRGSLPAPGTNLPLKLCFGSDFPYAKRELERLDQDGTRCLQTLAQGGLSTVWGAAVLPNLESEMAGWPLAGGLAPHYAAAARLLGIAGERDDLERLFPFHEAPEPSLKLSAQARGILDRLEAGRAPLREAGITFGRSRLAVRTRDDGTARACQYCGLCLSGCPYGAIWNSADKLGRLENGSRLSHQPGLVARKVEPAAGGGARVLCERPGGGTRELEADRVFLACGPVSTARLVIDSLAAYDRSFSLKFQPYFMLPMLAYGNTPGVASERLHTLSQLFVDIEDDAVERRLVHLQLYTYNEFIRRRLDSATWLLGPLRPLVRRLFEGRLLFFQGYLHSDLTDGIRVRSETPDGDGPARLSLSTPDLSGMRAAVDRVVAKLRKHSRRMGMFPLSTVMEYGIPGEGNHIGGTFPMRAEPGAFETGPDGALAELPGVHIVDSSVLPDLPATTLTYTVMANAHRIAEAAAADKPGGGS